MFPVRKFLLDQFFRIVYWTISHYDKGQDLIFMNYGYSDDDESALSEKDEINRYPIQLYDFVVSHITIDGLDILEVGSGRGGGAEYITRTYKPKSYKGVDLSKKAIDSCNRHYANEKLSFIQANAQNLPFQDGCFDAVLNVESSHRYSDFNKFFDEVYRVLKPGGHFLFADFRMTIANMTWEIDCIGPVQEKIENSGFKVIHRKTITANVIKALDISHDRRIEQIRRFTRRFRLSNSMSDSFSREFAAIKGSIMYDWFESGKCEYFFYVLKK